MPEATTIRDENRISADSHMAEPLDLWQQRMPERHRENALRFRHHEIGKGQYAREGGWDPRERLKDMAADGVSAEVLYPTRGKEIFRQGCEPEIAQISAHVYNDWMVEFCQEAPDRLWGQSLICLWDIDHAVRELEWSRKSGLRGASIWMIPPEGLPFDSNHYERFWSAAEELEMPISMHINQGFGEYAEGLDRGAGIVESVKRTCGGHKKIAMDVLTEFICSGVFERHPRLKLVLAELEVGWIPFWLEDMDRRFLKSREHGKFSLLPSEYFSRNIYATFTQDRAGGYLIGLYGEDNFLWSNDYPHPGCIWPYSDTVIEKTLGHLDPSVRRKVLCENVAQLYGMPIPEPMPRQPAPDMEAVWGRLWINRE
jgi:uncharacterized protein